MKQFCEMNQAELKFQLDTALENRAHEVDRLEELKALLPMARDEETVADLEDHIRMQQENVDTAQHFVTVINDLWLKAWARDVPVNYQL